MAQLPPNTPVQLRTVKSGSGQSAIVSKDDVPGGLPNVGYTVLLLGPHEIKDEEGNVTGTEEIVWTFFPGAPIKPSTTFGAGDEDITAREARERGIEWAKIQ